jgi:hypothetical protein
MALSFRPAPQSIQQLSHSATLPSNAWRRSHAHLQPRVLQRLRRRGALARVRGEQVRHELEEPVIGVRHAAWRAAHARTHTARHITRTRLRAQQALRVTSFTAASVPCNELLAHS